MSKIKKVTLGQVEYIAFRLAKELMAFDEPIPDFGTRFPNVLEGSIDQPFQSFGGQILYKGLAGKATILFYLMIKNHPFQNGNKRIAMATLFYFLHKNGKWLRVDNQELYNFAKWLAASNSKLKDEVVLSAEKFIRMHLIEI